MKTVSSDLDGKNQALSLTGVVKHLRVLNYERFARPYDKYEESPEYGGLYPATTVSDSIE